MSTRHVNRISADVPDGWAVMESAELQGPDDIRITVTAQACPPELDTEQLAHRHAELLDDQLAGYVEDALTPTTSFTGQAAMRRDLHFGTDEQPGRSITVYLAANGAAYIASATGPAPSVEAHDATITGIIERMALIGIPLVVASTGEVSGDRSAAQNGDGSAPPTSPAPSPAAWSDLRRRWTEATSGPSTTEGSAASATFSSDELLVIAAALGAGLFPSVSPFAFADLSGAERAVIGGALGRALVTRGVLDQVDGRLVPGADPSIGLLDLAVRPDLLVEISHAATSAPTMHALCLRADAMVVVEPCGPFGRRISNADAARLVDEATDVVTSALAHGDGEVTARATWRDGDGVLATELTWAPGDVVSSDEIRAALLAHLPGAEPAL